MQALLEQLKGTAPWLVVGLAAGWFLRPPDVQVVERQVVVVQEKVVKVAEAKKAQRVITVRETAKQPDGTRTSRTETVRATDTETRQASARETAAQSVVTYAAPRRADWRVGALLGYVPSATGAMAAVTVERRVAGPLWAGAWVAGTSPVTAFQPAFGAAGISLAVEF